MFFPLPSRSLVSNTRIMGPPLSLSLLLSVIVVPNEARSVTRLMGGHNGVKCRSQTSLGTPIIVSVGTVSGLWTPYLLNRTDPRCVHHQFGRRLGVFPLRSWVRELVVRTTRSSRSVFSPTMFRKGTENNKSIPRTG